MHLPSEGIERHNKRWNALLSAAILDSCFDTSSQASGSMDSFFSPPLPPSSLVLLYLRGISKRLPRRLNSIFYFVVCLQQRLKMDIGVLASLKAVFEDATNGFPAKWSHPRNGRKHSFGRIHFAGKAVVFLAAVFWWRRKMSAVFSGFVCAKSEFVPSKIGKPPPC